MNWWEEYKKTIIGWAIVTFCGGLLTFVGLIWDNSRSFPTYKSETEKEIIALKEEIKEVKRDAKERDDKWWELYVELNTNLVGQKYKLDKELKTNN